MADGEREKERDVGRGAVLCVFLQH